MVAITSELPNIRAAAPSPNNCSDSPPAAPSLQSAAVTMTLLADPLLTASIAKPVAILPDLNEWLKSAVRVSLDKSVAAAIILAPCFSWYGGVVVAKNKPSTAPLSNPLIQSRAAATPMVMLSSS